MALQLRHSHKQLILLSNPKPFFPHFLSTATNITDTPTPPPTSPDSNPSDSPSSSFFNDVKSSLKNQPPSPPPPTQQFNSSNPNPRPKIASFDEIRRNLAEYRRRSDLPAPNQSQSPLRQNISFQELYNRNAMNREQIDGERDKGMNQMMSFDAIRESLRTLKNSGRDGGVVGGRREMQPMSLTALRNSLNSRNEGSGGRTVIGSGFNLTGSLFRKHKEKEGEDGGERAEEKKAELLRSYSHVELGERLKGLRPDKKVGFSLSEMNERLVKLRELEEKQSMSRMSMGKHRPLDDLRESLRKLNNVNEETSQEKMGQRLSILNQIAPSTIQGPPKEQLVEKYFHPDNMSAAEKLKLELAAVRDEFKMSESDCGSARVQVAQLTTKIKYLSDSLHKKDKHSRKGLNAMVQLRKKLLKYLRRTDWDSYTMVLSKLGLRDNADVKKNLQNS